MDRSEIKNFGDRHLLTSAPGGSTTRENKNNKLNVMLSLSDAISNCPVKPPTTADPQIKKRRPQNNSTIYQRFTKN